MATNSNSSRNRSNQNKNYVVDNNDENNVEVELSDQSGMCFIYIFTTKQTNTK